MVKVQCIQNLDVVWGPLSPRWGGGRAVHRRHTSITTKIFSTMMYLCVSIYVYI